MFDFLIRKSVVKSTQKFIDRLTPKVNVHTPEDLPLPSLDALKKYCVTVAKINALEDQMKALSDEALKSKTFDLKKRFREAIDPTKAEHERLVNPQEPPTSQESQENLVLEIERSEEEYFKTKQNILNEILPEAFAVVREAGRRVLSMRHFDVQLIGGMSLHEGSIAEMTTGEGKTLVATLAAYLNALTGEGVHVVTVNDYLARRDRDWMGPLYEFLGLTVGVIQHDMMPSERQQFYACDITYGTNNEFGFDYLRDNMVNFKDDMVQRPHHFAIVDEVDSILIDEARTPLIISGPAEESADTYYKAKDIARQLKGRRVTEQDEITAKHKGEDLSIGYDYLAEEKQKSVALTETGEEKVSLMFGIPNLHDMETIEYRHHILQALKAKEFFRLDVDYVVRDGEVIIVDEFTGRMMPGRRWSDGLHQAVEAKEGIRIERENQTLATITFQNYFRLYQKLAGMTGTAYTEANEFKQIYKLDCVIIPTNKIVQRVNHPDCIFKSQKEKYTAVVAEIEELYKKGRPVLVGTISIEKSEVLSRMLKTKGITHQVLNAKYHELEAQIIAQAGRFQAVTIATNMAGRGTDIVLGGNAEYLARTLAEQKMKESKDKKETAHVEDLTRKFIEQFRKQVKEEHEKVVALGGLHVLGTERHESRRIDNQLRGRQGRQGDPGSSRFYVSFEDDLMRLFASDRMWLIDKLWSEDGMALEHPMLSKTIEIAQKRVENHNFEIRKHLLEYDDVMNKQREVIYSLRRSVLERENVKDQVLLAIEETIAVAVKQYFVSPQDVTTWDIDGLDLYLKTKFNYDLLSQKENIKEMTPEEIEKKLIKDILALYEAREKEFDPAGIRQMERMFLLHTIDSKWKDHLYTMDQVKEGIGLRSYGQRDPLVEYKREAYRMFEIMYGSISIDIAETIFKIQPITAAARLRGVFSSIPQKLVHQEITGLSDVARQAQSAVLPGNESAPQQTSSGPVRNTEEKIGRNDPCPCGSGKKYKKCCGQ